MVSSCFIKGCDSLEHAADRSFHRFPPEHDSRRRGWLEAIKKQNGWMPPCPYAPMICSRHFRPEDFERRGKTKRTLKTTGLPRLFLKWEETDPLIHPPGQSGERKQQPRGSDTAEKALKEITKLKRVTQPTGGTFSVQRPMWSFVAGA